LVEITDEFMDAILARVRPYTILFLKVGPHYQPPEARPPELAAIVREHGRRNMQLREEGKMALVGPVAGARPIVGICIFTVPEDEARALMEDDPAIKANLFVPEYATWYGSPGDGLPLA
jgi:hypothetical protein